MLKIPAFGKPRNRYVLWLDARPQPTKTTMIKVFIYCFDKWWRPLLFFAFIAGLLIINSELNIRLFKKPLQILSNVSIYVLLISFVYQLYKRRYLKGFITIFIVFVTGILSIMVTMIDGDHWADDLKIPTGIQIENPVNMDNYSRPDSIIRLNKIKTDLVLYNSVQPGMYEYDFWTDKIESGTIYLKAFEISQDEELSHDNVIKDSKISISNSSDSITRFSSKRNFTIYEGDWGKFYAARFEVWFMPTSGGEERRLFQKNFKIEGWMH